VPPTQGEAETSVDAGVGKGTTPSTPPTPTANVGDAGSTATEATGASTRTGGCSVASGGARSEAFIFLGLAAALALLARKRA
jgi:MYXO-CTERM domain-containing protein